MNQTLISLCLALATNELIHNFVEIKGMREKLKRLSCYIAGDSYKELPININTRAKSYSISLLAFVIIVGFLWLFYGWLALETTLAFQMIAILLIGSYAVTAITVDKWHIEIESITRPFRQKTSKRKGSDK
jgi:hypothetical protein